MSLIMGIVNVTPDSFSDGGNFYSKEAAIQHALQLLDDGADIIDVGGESTRPGAEPVSQEQELERVIPVISEIKDRRPEAVVSVDTRKSEVARRAVEAGATIVNDVSAGRYDPEMLATVASLQAPYILMHMKGEPQTMQENPEYDDVVRDVAMFLQERVNTARAAGIKVVYVDPGIGFGKTVEHNLALLRNLQQFSSIAPLVLGVSRKRFLGTIFNIEEASQRDLSTALVHALLISKPIHLLRVHNVALISQLRKLHEALI